MVCRLGPFPWELEPAGRRGQGLCSLAPSQDPPGLALSISPLWSADRATAVKNGCAFDFYLAVPLLEGSRLQALDPYLLQPQPGELGFRRRRSGSWAEKGYQTVHCHNDGDYYGDGLFWRDGSYPPYPDMDGYDKVLADCRRGGDPDRDLFFEQGAPPEHPGVQGARRGVGAQGPPGRRSGILSSAARASSAPRCASGPAGSTI